MHTKSWIPMLILVSAGLIGTARSEPALAVHVTDASYAGCTALDVDTLTCTTTIVEGSSAHAQFVWILAADVWSIAGVQFAIEYDSSVSVVGWTSCAGGLQIPETGWPASGTGVAVTWDEPEYPDGPDGLAVVGYLTVEAGSTGVVTVVNDSRIGRAEYTDADGVTHTIAPGHLGVADVAGSGGGERACEDVRDPALFLHVVESTTVCADLDSLDCSTVVTADGDGTVSHRVYLLASGIADLKVLSFGLDVDAGLRFSDWSTCGGGTSRALGGWPSRGAGVTVSWDTAQTASSAGGLIPVGYFDVDAYSVGEMRVIAPFGAEAPSFAGSPGPYAFVDTDFLGAAAIAGSAPPNICGSGDPSNPAPPAGATEIPRQYLSFCTDSPAEPWIYDCQGVSGATLPWALQDDWEDVLDEAPGYVAVPHAIVDLSVGTASEVTFSSIVGKDSRYAMVTREFDGGVEWSRWYNGVGQPGDDGSVGDMLGSRRNESLIAFDGTSVFVADRRRTYDGKTDLAIMKVDATDGSVDWSVPYASTELPDGDETAAGVFIRGGCAYVVGFTETASQRRQFVLKVSGTGAIESEFTLPVFALQPSADIAVMDPRPGGLLWIAGESRDAGGVSEVVLVAVDLATMIFVEGVSLAAGEGSAFPGLIAIGEDGTLAMSARVQYGGTVRPVVVFRNLDTQSDYTYYCYPQLISSDYRLTGVAVGRSGEIYVSGWGYHQAVPLDRYSAFMFRIDPDGLSPWETVASCSDDYTLAAGMDVAITTEGRPVMAMAMPSTGCDPNSCTAVAVLNPESGFMNYVSPLSAIVPSVGPRTPYRLMVVDDPTSSQHFRAFVLGYYDETDPWGYWSRRVYMGSLLMPHDFALDVAPELGSVGHGAAMSVQSLSGGLRVSMEGTAAVTSRVDLFDVQGRLVATKPLANHHAAVEFHSLSTGVYFVRAIDEEGVRHARGLVTR